MWSVGAGIGVIIALAWTTVQLVQASAEQGVEPAFCSCRRCFAGIGTSRSDQEIGKRITHAGS